MHNFWCVRGFQAHPHIASQLLLPLIAISGRSIGTLTLKLVPHSLSRTMLQTVNTHLLVYFNIDLGRGELLFEAFSKILTVMLNFWCMSGFQAHPHISVPTTFATDCRRCRIQIWVNLSSGRWASMRTESRRMLMNSITWEGLTVLDATTGALRDMKTQSNVLKLWKQVIFDGFGNKKKNI